jgi:hypothetical protein
MKDILQELDKLDPLYIAEVNENLELIDDKEDIQGQVSIYIADETGRIIDIIKRSNTVVEQGRSLALQRIT